MSDVNKLERGKDGTVDGVPVRVLNVTRGGIATVQIKETGYSYGPQIRQIRESEVHNVTEAHGPMNSWDDK